MQHGFGLFPYTEIKRKIQHPSEILENPRTIGEHIRRERQIRGLRQVDVAEALHLDPHTICDWENGKKSIGHPDTIRVSLRGSVMIRLLPLNPKAKHYGKSCGDLD
ncbi:helix-turn-helix domain-containing protein [Parasphingopyxis algicola]|uniref:helix-turn-helix domain-containing protein n=1 Tax=Parasphingopyxis algicola TaxID=2026624 RepID=UPI0015A3FFB1|nr:helix-turn-helix transcriptional regulator [Parasphingopyxis algicola]QLC24403.1 helix-turn-helix domain-containing protein [Parasphingopyxis algicola]